MSEASLPSISPEWMPFWIKTMGFPSALAASAVNTRSLETITSGRSRPCPVRPKLSTLTQREPASSCRQ